MKLHKLKTDPEVFLASLKGDKQYEIRFDDRDFQVGDLLVLQETACSGEEMKNGKELAYTGRTLLMDVVHKLTGYGLQDGWCILGVKPSYE